MGDQSYNYGQRVKTNSFASEMRHTNTANNNADYEDVTPSIIAISRRTMHPARPASTNVDSNADYEDVTPRIVIPRRTMHPARPEPNNADYEDVTPSRIAIPRRTMLPARPASTNADNFADYEDVTPSRPTTAASTNLEKDTLASMETALSSFDSTFKQCAPWTNFHQQLQDHARTRRAYASSSGVLAGQLMELLLSVDTQYFQATQPHFEWCGETLPLLNGYKTLMDVRDDDTIDGQKELLREILRTDVEQSYIALSRLEHMFLTLQTASTKLDTLILQLHDDFAEGSQFYKNEIAAAQLSAGNNLTTMGLIKHTMKASLENLTKYVSQVQFLRPVLNILGNITSDAANNQMHADTKLKAEFADIYNFCKNLWTKLNEQANIDFGTIASELTSKIQAVGSAKDEIESNGFPRQRNIVKIKTAVNNLQNRCRAYRSRYRQV